MEEDHSFRIGSGEVEAHMLQVDQVAEYGNDVKGEVVVAVAAQCARTNNCHGGHTEYYQALVGSGRSGQPVAVAGVVGSGPVGSFLQRIAGW